MRKLFGMGFILGLSVLACTACGSGGKTDATTLQPEKQSASQPGSQDASQPGNTTAQSKTGGSLVLYTSTAQDNLDIVIPEFEKKTGIKVEVIRGSTGEIYARIQAESQNPYGDVTWIPESYVLNDTSYFEKYISSSNGLYEEAYQNTSGYATNINYAVPVIIYNKDLAGFEIKGYADLLKPELKGKIAMGNASSSSSAYNQLENMLLAMGTGATPDEKADSKEAWDYVGDFLKNLDGIIVDSSSATYKGVLSGEYAVGMSWDTPAQEYLADKISNIGVVYMSEGVVPKQSSAAIIKNAKNLENAKAFVEYMSGREGQELLGQKVLGANPLMGGIQIAPYKVDITKLPAIPITTKWSSGKKADILNQYQNLYLSIME